MELQMMGLLLAWLCLHITAGRLSCPFAILQPLSVALGRLQSHHSTGPVLGCVSLAPLLFNKSLGLMHPHPSAQGQMREKIHPHGAALCPHWGT
jgi:hypothetical protein